MNRFNMTSVCAAIIVLATSIASAQQNMTPEMQKAMEFFGQAGNPEGRWIEGETMVPHVEAGPHFKASMLYYPGTEELQEDEIRVSFNGFDLLPIARTIWHEHFR